MGTVYKAHHAALDRIVAIKVMRLVKEPRAVTRFRREIRAAARLVHPNIVHATDADEANGTHYLVMEFVEGTDLAAYVRERGPLSVETAIQFLLQAAQGLEHAHQRGVVHRDMKPSNLLLDRDGTVKVLDMGLARLDSADGEQDQLTGTGQVMGTVDFMAPEQAQNTKQADARVDIYSLGVTLWYLLTGRILYSGDSVLSKLLAHQRDPIPSLHEACPQASRELERVFTKMVAKSPDDRYCSMSTVIADLRSCLTALSPSPVRQASDFPTAQNQHVALSIRPAVGARRLRHPPKRPTSIVLALGVAGLLLVAATIIIKITLPDGTTTEIRVADGSKIEIIGEQGPKVAKTGDRPTPQGGIEQGAAANYALEFDGVDDNVEIPGLELPELDEYTIEALIEPRDVPAHPGRGVIIALYGRNRANFDVRWSTTEEKLPSLYAMSSNGYVTTSSLGLPNRPTHLAFCRTREQMRLYLDGKSVVEKPIDATATQRGSGANPQPCRIGAFRDDSNALRWFFDGVIDEVRISKGIRYAADFTPALRHQPDANTVALYHFDEGTGDVLKDSSSYYRHGKVYGATWVPQSDPTGLPAASDPRRVAQWVLEHGANVVVTVKSPEPQSITISNPIGLPAGAFELTGLRLRFGSTDDQALEKLLALPFQWKRIYLTGTKVTDVTLRRLNSQTELVELYVGGAPVTEAGIEELAHHRKLTTLWAEQQRLTDASVPALMKLKQLRHLHLRKNHLTAAGVNRLLAALPQCSIYTDLGNFTPGKDRIAQEAGLEFDGVDDYVHVPSLRLERDVPLTIEAIVTLSSISQRDYSLAIASDTSLAGALMYYAAPDMPEGTWTAHIIRASGQITALNPRSPDTEALGRRLHLAMVCGKDQVSLYADGKPAADSNIFPPHPADEHLGDGFTLGASLTKEGTTFRNFPGRIHAVRISKAARYMGDFAPVR
ncbi:MAG: protein kinase, partial [Pirellulaceae bacterium]